MADSTSIGAHIGIDLGTTNSAAAMVYDDGPNVIPRGRGELIPSVVSYRWRSGLDDVLVGAEAANENHSRVIHSIKRLMGRTYQSALEESADGYFHDERLQRRFQNDLVLSLVDDGGQPHNLWPHEISARILEAVKMHAESHLQVPIAKAVITVPAYFQDPHRAATLEAARLAGIEVWEPLLDEPTAAALAFGRSVGVSIDEPLLVVDWGGGTFDVTLLANHGRDWMQLGVGGDLNLGGDDIDAELARWVLEQNGLPDELMEDLTVSHLLLREARRVKHRLSDNEEAAFSCVFSNPLTGDQQPVTTMVRRNELEELAQPLVERGLASIEPCIETGELALDDVKKVLLVGGSTRLPFFRKRIEELLGHARIHDEVDPMHAVALGAAIYASQERPDIARLCPYGYAIRNGSELIEVIPPDMEVPTPLDVPFRIDRSLRTTYDGQTVYRVLLHRFTRHESLRNISGPSFERIFARDMPSSPEGSEVGLELWLDDNKVLHARIFPPGDAPPREVEASMSEIGKNAVLTTLADRSLETEALLEANRENPSGVFQRLETNWHKAGDALENQEFETCEDLVQELEDGLELAHTEHGSAEAKERVFGWLGFYERILLPTFWEVIPPEGREEIVKRIRALRVMTETMAPDEDLELELFALHEQAEAGEIGLILRSFRVGHMHGVPAGISRELVDLSIAAARARISNHAEKYQELKSKLKSKLEEVGELLRDWRERGDVHVASPDLRVDDAGAGRKG
jgi:molecular chaperone DnaK (HSP70)